MKRGGFSYVGAWSDRSPCHNHCSDGVFLTSNSNTMYGDQGSTTQSRSLDGLTVGTTLYSHISRHDEFHFHENATICFLVRGGGIEDRRGSRYERSSCDIRFYAAGEPHRSVIKVFPSECVNIDIAPCFLNRHDISEISVSKAIAGEPSFRSLMLKIRSELAAGDDLTAGSIQMLFLSMIEPSRVTPKRPAWLARICEAINDSWAEPISLKSLADAADVHPVTVSKQFSRHFFCSLGEYTRRIRIDRSLPLIRNSDLTLTEIALLCGFADQSHFTRTFKKLTGHLPKELRNIQ